MTAGGTMPKAQIATKVFFRLTGLAGRFGPVVGARDHFVALRFADDVAGFAQMTGAGFCFPLLRQFESSASHLAALRA
jgi:hypothetical protein